MQIRIKTSGAVMYEGEFRQLYASTSFPQQISEATLNDFGADVVFEGPQASPTRYQIAYRDGVEQIDGKWFTKYSVTEMDDEAKAIKNAEQAKSVRATRDGKLAETDWRYRRDQTTTPEWDAYCQALRDVPAQEGFPWTITWPVAP